MAGRDRNSPNFIDKLVGYVNPVAGVTRLAARHRLTEFGYHSVNATKARGGSGGMWQNAGPNTVQMETERIKLIWDARDQELNIPFTRGLLSRTAHFVVPQLRYQAGTDDKLANQEYEQYIEEKMKKADLGGRHSLSKLAEMAYRAKQRDGDCGFIKTEDPDVPTDLKLESVTADCIGDVQRAQHASEDLVGGVRLDLKRARAPLGYQVYDRNRNNQYSLRDEVPAIRFLHVWDAFRTDQVRGHSPLATVMPSIRDLYEVFQYDMMGIKFAASFAGFIKTGNPFGGSDAAQWDGKDPVTGLNFIKAREGTVMKLPEGAEYQQAPASQRPSGAFLNFVETKIREISLGVDLPYSFLWDLAKFGGVTARLETRYADARFAYERRDLQDQMLDEWKNGQLRRGIEAGDIRPRRDYKKGKWNFGPAIGGDLLNETQARVIAIQNGLTTATDEIEKAGGDFEEVVRTQARQVKIKQSVSEETGVPMELLDQSLAQPTALLAAMNERDGSVPGPPEEPPMPSGLLAQHGGDMKAAKPVLDILKQYNQGLMTYEQAIGTLTSLYGMSAEEAMQILPPSTGT
jgi:capsid protein